MKVIFDGMAARFCSVEQVLQLRTVPRKMVFVTSEDNFPIAQTLHHTMIRMQASDHLIDLKICDCSQDLYFSRRIFSSENVQVWCVQYAATKYGSLWLSSINYDSFLVHIRLPHLRLLHTQRKLS